MNFVSSQLSVVSCQFFLRTTDYGPLTTDKAQSTKYKEQK
jgi:hypothetical protein